MAGKMPTNYAEWVEFSRRDDCLDLMVPGDLRSAMACAALHEREVCAQIAIDADEQDERDNGVAYKRGAAWWRENGTAPEAVAYLDKAAFDYADKAVSEARTRAQVND